MQRRNWPLILAVLLWLMGVCGYLLFYSPRVAEVPRVAWLSRAFWRKPTPTSALPTPSVPVATPVATEEATPAFTLPPLRKSDPTVIDLARGLSTHPQLGTWLETEGLTRRFVVSVVNLGDGVSPAPQVLFLKPAGKFQTKKHGQSQFIDPSSYQRYDLIADVFTSLDPQACAAAYRTAKPLIDAAYDELGMPNRNFDDVLAQAITQLLATPVVDADIELRPLAITYAFANPKLEALPPAQRQFLRMGARNVRRIQTHLRAIASALGVSEGTSPGN